MIFAACNFLQGQAHGLPKPSALQDHFKLGQPTLGTGLPNASRDNNAISDINAAQLASLLGACDKLKWLEVEGVGPSSGVTNLEYLAAEVLKITSAGGVERFSRPLMGICKYRG